MPTESRDTAPWIWTPAEFFPRAQVTGVLLFWVVKTIGGIRKFPSRRRPPLGRRSFMTSLASKAQKGLKRGHEETRFEARQEQGTGPVRTRGPILSRVRCQFCHIRAALLLCVADGFPVRRLWVGNSNQPTRFLHWRMQDLFNGFSISRISKSCGTAQDV